MKLGTLDISACKFGTQDPQIYLGTTKIYPTEPTPTPTLQWVDYSVGDTIAANTDIYGFSGNAANISDSLGGVLIRSSISRTTVSIEIYDSQGQQCYLTEVTTSDDISIIFSDVSCGDYLTNTSQMSVVGGSIKLYQAIP